ncbi:MAG: NOP5/NOP56 family protein, partial [Halobacteriota archaeon]
MEEAWFAELDDDPASATRAIRSGSAETPRDWPALAVESGVAPDESGYYELLHEATVAAAREAVSERERADDQ